MKHFLVLNPDEEAGFSEGILEFETLEEAQKRKAELLALNPRQSIVIAFAESEKNLLFSYPEYRPRPKLSKP